MKNLFVAFSIIVIFLGNSCFASNSSKIMKNNAYNCLETGKIRSILAKNAPVNYFPPNANLCKLGVISSQNNTQFRLFLSTLEWGNKRQTKRIVVISNDWRYLGNYRVSESPSIIKKNKLYFDFDEDDGNTITFVENEPPDEAYLDGEIIEFDSSIE